MNAYEIENIIVGNQKEFRKTFERSSMLNKIANKVTYINTHNRFFHDFENIYKVTTGHCLGQNSHVQDQLSQANKSSAIAIIENSEFWFVQVYNLNAHHLKLSYQSQEIVQAALIHNGILYLSVAMNKIFIYDLKPFSMPTANIKMKQISAALWGQLLVEPLGTEAVCIAFVDMHIYCAYVNQIERIGTHSSWLTKAVVFPTHQLLGYLQQEEEPTEKIKRRSIGLVTIESMAHSPPTLQTLFGLTVQTSCANGFQKRYVYIISVTPSKDEQLLCQTIIKQCLAITPSQEEESPTELSIKYYSDLNLVLILDGGNLHFWLYGPDGENSFWSYRQTVHLESVLQSFWLCRTLSSRLVLIVSEHLSNTYYYYLDDLHTNIYTKHYIRLPCQSPDLAKHFSSQLAMEKHWFLFCHYEQQSFLLIEDGSVLYSSLVTCESNCEEIQSQSQPNHSFFDQSDIGLQHIVQQSKALVLDREFDQFETDQLKRFCELINSLNIARLESMLQVYHHPEYLGHFPCLLFDSDFKIDGTNIHLDCQKLKWIFFRQFLKEMKTIVIGLDKYVEKNQSNTKNSGRKVALVQTIASKIKVKLFILTQADQVIRKTILEDSPTRCRFYNASQLLSLSFEEQEIVQHLCYQIWVTKSYNPAKVNYLQIVLDNSSYFYHPLVYLLCKQKQLGQLSKAYWQVYSDMPTDQAYLYGLENNLEYLFGFDRRMQRGLETLIVRKRKIREGNTDNKPQLATIKLEEFELADIISFYEEDEKVTQFQSTLLRIHHQLVSESQYHGTCSAYSRYFREVKLNCQTYLPDSIYHSIYLHQSKNEQMFCESSRICEPIEGIGQFNIDVVTLRLLLQCYLNAISLIGSYANRSAEDQSDVFEQSNQMDESQWGACLDILDRICLHIGRKSEHAPYLTREFSYGRDSRKKRQENYFSLDSSNISAREDDIVLANYTKQLLALKDHQRTIRDLRENQSQSSSKRSFELQLYNLRLRIYILHYIFKHNWCEDTQFDLEKGQQTALENIHRLPYQLDCRKNSLELSPSQEDLIVVQSLHELYFGCEDL